MASPRSSLLIDIALTLALITLVTILLNAGIFWLVLERAEVERRTDGTLALSAALAAQLEVAAQEGDPERGFRAVLQAYKATDLDAIELYVADRSMHTLASVSGVAPAVPDAGFRAALFGREQHSAVEGSRFATRSVVVTSPIAPRGDPVAALRVRMALASPFPLGGPVGFVLLYTVFSGAAVGIFGFSLLRRRLLQPVDALRAGTMRIAAGDFGHMVEVEASRELEEMRGALNTMSASLQAYRERTARQVQDLERANEDLRRAQEALVRSERLAGVGRLAAGLAHEVGNPLSAVIGFVDLLAQELDDPKLEQDLVERSRRELARIQRIIRDLLDYARAGSGAVEEVVLTQALEEAAGTLRPQPGFRAIDLHVGVSAGTPTIRIEPDKLHQVLVNLLMNAADALEERGGGRIWLTSRLVDGEVEIRCEDDGAGFDPTALDRGFDPFFTTKEVGEGTGLGLSTCLQVVEQAGGSMGLENRPEGGACVRIRLPRAS